MAIDRNTTQSLNRPAFIGIHQKDDSTKVLYVSSGIRQALGFLPSQVVNAEAKSFISDGFDNKDYMKIYESQNNGDEEHDDDMSSAFTWEVNLKTASGGSVLHRLVGFSCENSILFIGISFPEAPPTVVRELEAQALDGAMKRLNVTRESNKKKLAAAQENVPLYYSQSRQVKATLVLERGDGVDTEETGRRPNGPLVVFVTGSMSRIIDADPSDLHRFPFLKLVAPECILQVSRYFDKLNTSMDVLFETFSLLARPYVIDGDVAVSDADNQRVVVECLGAAVQDGVAIMLRKLKTAAPPKKDCLGNYITVKIDSDSDKEHISLFDLVSSEPDTSDLCIKAYLTSYPYADKIVQIVARMIDSGLPCFKEEATLSKLGSSFQFNRSKHEAALFIEDRTAELYENNRSVMYDQIQKATNGIPY
ncbi:phosphatidylinositol-4- kinase [Coemansia sp. RSA 1972]|nr:phosphatidylinositol-4- kinase [Coemansia sp. RSA 1972]